ncbi:class I SAM-dependent methyltransferase [Kutzneria sp. CA-103260]|uniref:class I SAM-dependent methyltransferase n=1 Tax=Kutzneria sp. CA-103260 TaxID=2802641 RepID=UPI001BABE497|nr:class I SAM-dependent methyltransferase [Kutzneria sp. CA-103260]QUQ63342.1 Methyltransferase domain protein [Kutzneria sp. CA-103260]
MWDNGWREIAAVDEALADGVIGQQEWHEAMADLLRQPYLNASTPWGQSGKGGTARDWVTARRVVVEAIGGDGTFLDVGCANGYLMECVAIWTAEQGLDVEPHGVDIVPEFVALTRKRLPGWADRIHHGNALTWNPPQRYDFVRTGLEYVPANRREAFVKRLLNDVGDRLVIGPYTVDVGDEQTERALKGWGIEIAGRVELPHENPSGTRKLLWVDQS